MNRHDTEHQADTATHFSTAAAGLPTAVATGEVDLADGDTINLRIAPVVKQLGDDTVRMLAYNGSIPGPTLRVREGSEVTVRRHQRRRHRGDRALARPATREPLRRYPRDAGADPRRRDLHLSDRVPRSRPLLVPPAHP